MSRSLEMCRENTSVSVRGSDLNTERKSGTADTLPRGTQVREDHGSLAWVLHSSRTSPTHSCVLLPGWRGEPECGGLLATQERLPSSVTCMCQTRRAAEPSRRRGRLCDHAAAEKILSEKIACLWREWRVTKDLGTVRPSSQQRSLDGGTRTAWVGLPAARQGEHGARPWPGSSPRSGAKEGGSDESMSPRVGPPLDTGRLQPSSGFPVS